MARTGRRYPIRTRLVPFPPQIFQESAGLTVVTGMTAGATQTAPGTATLPVIFGVLASQFTATMTVVTGVTAGATLTLQQTATLAVDFELGAAATQAFTGTATLPAVFAIGAISGELYSAALAVVTSITAIPTVGTLTLICSVASAPGTDTMGNAYPQGLCVGVPLGAQVKADTSGNLSVGGNLLVGGSITNTALAATLSVLSASVSSIAATAATNSANINALQNQAAGLQNQISNLLSGNVTIGGSLSTGSQITANGGSGNLNGNLQGTINGQTLGGSQVALLATLHKMNHQGDVNSGAALTTLITAYNNTLHELQNSNYQS